jgi:hypothetical protein
MSIHHGDCIEVMATMPEASVDAIVTDPPYGLEFMGKEWDSLKFAGGGNEGRVSGTGINRNSPRFYYQNGKAQQQWHEQWATEAFRVLKPGGYLLAFGGTRTYHRLASAIEDAGFEIRDTLMWIYASGFPKSLDVSKALDKVAPRDAMFVPFARHYGEQRKASGMTHAQVCAAIGAHGEVNHGGASTNWEAGYNVPTLAYWHKLQPLLDLSDEWLPLIERIEAEREKIGEADSGLHRGSGTTVAFGEGTDRRAVDITAPATDLARKWEGWGTALKPAHEPIVMARKPLVGTVAANVTRYGTGALNIDGTRIGGPDGHGGGAKASGGFVNGYQSGDGFAASTQGRWPSNVLLDPEHPELFDEPNPEVVGSGATTTDGVAVERNGGGGAIFRADRSMPAREDRGYGGGGGYSRFFIVPKSDRRDREPVLRAGPNNVYCTCETDKPEWVNAGRLPQGRTATTSRAKAISEATSTDGFDWPTSSSGSEPSGPSRRGNRSTTSTATSKTTESPISSSSIPSPISGSTQAASSSTGSGGSDAPSAGSTDSSPRNGGTSARKAGRSTAAADPVTSPESSKTSVCDDCGGLKPSNGGPVEAADGVTRAARRNSHPT